MFMPVTLTVAGYSIAWFLLAKAIRTRAARAPLALAVVFAALLLHCVSVYHQLVVPGGYQFSLIKIASLFFWVVNFLVLLAALRKPLHNLFLLSLPLTVLALLVSLYSTSNAATPPSKLTPGMITHILLSIAAYSTLIVATLQALALAYQNYQLRHKHPTGFVRLLPPLETMEQLLFQLLWVGEILLTVAMLAGLPQIQNISEQHLLHKVVFSACAWLIYAVLLWGHHARGWRGQAAVRWTLTGFAFLVLAYFGTKFVLELILDTQTTF